MSKNKKAFLQLFGMIIISILTQFVLLMRTSFIAAEFGTGLELDAFNFANSIGTFIFSFIGTGVTTVLIPSFINKKDNKSISSFINCLYIIAFIFLLVIYANRRMIATILSTGDSNFIIMASNVMLITLVTQFINSFSAVTNAIYQCVDKYNCPKIINFIIGLLLVFLLLLNKQLSIYTYAFLILITTILSILLQFIFLPKQYYKYNIYINFKNSEFKNMLKVFFPTMLSTGLYQLSLMIDVMIASNLGEGNISVLTYSNTIINMLNTVLLANLMTYFYPKLSKYIHQKNSQHKLFDLIILLLTIMCLIVIGFLIVGKDGLIILYERGQFTSEITTIVFKCTILYIITLPFNAIRDLIYRYFYAKQDTLTPFKNSLIVSTLNIIISIILVNYCGIYGIIFGTLIASFISLVMIIIRFNKKFNITIDKSFILKEIIKIIIITLLTLFIILCIKNYLPIFNSLINIIIYGGLTVIVYALLLLTFKSHLFKIKL